MADVQLSAQGAIIKTAYEGEADTNAFDDAAAAKLAGLQANAADTPLAKLGSPTYETIQQMQDTFHSSGTISGGAVSQGAGVTVDLAAGTGFIRATDSDVAQLLFFDWGAESSLAIPTDSTRYLGVDYNAGSPQAILLTTNTFDDHTQFPLAVITNEADTIYIANAPFKVGDHAGLMIKRLNQTMGVQRDDETGGLMLGETGTRNITVTPGALWSSLNRATQAAVDTSVSGTFNRYYDDNAGGFTKQLTQTQWNNTQYDDGSGTLVTLGANKYACQWFYETLGGAISCMFGAATIGQRVLGVIVSQKIAKIAMRRNRGPAKRRIKRTLNSRRGCIVLFENDTPDQDAHHPNAIRHI